MRDIIFRGKRIDNGEWVEGFLWSKRTIGYTSPIGNTDEIVIDTATVGQYTGLTDKNDKRIFEGDVVHCVSRTDSGNMVVIFEDGEFRMVLCENYKSYVSGGGFYAPTIRCFEKEVVGNIYDNPDLLK